MAVEETKEQQQIYNLFRNFIYLTLLLELFINVPLYFGDPVSKFLYELIYRFGFFNNVEIDKLIELVCVGITCLGTRAKKNLKFNMKTMVVYPMCIGFSLVLFSVFIHKVTMFALAKRPECSLEASRLQPQGKPLWCFSMV